MAKKGKELLQNNQRRVARMRIWMKQAEEVPHGDEHDHIRLLFYFIAYEAAYQQEKISKEPQWKSFNRVVSRFAKIEVLKALQAHNQNSFYYSVVLDVVDRAANLSNL